MLLTTFETHEAGMARSGALATLPACATKSDYKVSIIDIPSFDFNMRNITSSWSPQHVHVINQESRLEYNGFHTISRFPECFITSSTKPVRSWWDGSLVRIQY